jgi:error-prone DNA polymerase
MAAWRRTGRIERHRERLISRMTAKGIAPEFAERVFEQIRGFGEYGFPESHAASFALIAYATAWLKRHYPDVFACALLNAQPMGFYSPSTIVEDAKRHGVAVEPVDVLKSRRDCTLEPATGGRHRFAIRMGLRYVKGLGKAQAERIEQARAERPFSSIEELVRRTGLDTGIVGRLAESGALSGLDRHRRSALWRAHGAGRQAAPALVPDETLPRLAALDLFETIGWDYRTTGHSPRGHPLAPLRPELRARRLPDAAAVRAMRHGRRVRYAGLVICRQRPGTASGVVFLTLEDETGFVNVVIFKPAYEEHRVLIKSTAFLGVTGKLQIQEGVVHIIAERFWDPRRLIGARPASGGSRDFR